MTSSTNNKRMGTATTTAHLLAAARGMRGQRRQHAGTRGRAYGCEPCNCVLSAKGWLPPPPPPPPNASSLLLTPTALSSPRPQRRVPRLTAFHSRAPCSPVRLSLPPLAFILRGMARQWRRSVSVPLLPLRSPPVTASPTRLDRPHNHVRSVARGCVMMGAMRVRAAVAVAVKRSRASGRDEAR